MMAHHPYPEERDSKKPGTPFVPTSRCRGSGDSAWLGSEERGLS